MVGNEVTRSLNYYNKENAGVGKNDLSDTRTLMGMANFRRYPRSIQVERLDSNIS